jgi:hypothetical protein
MTNEELYRAKKALAKCDKIDYINSMLANLLRKDSIKYIRFAYANDEFNIWAGKDNVIVGFVIDDLVNYLEREKAQLKKELDEL